MGSVEQTYVGPVAIVAARRRQHHAGARCSSGGSASAVAALLCMGATATDTGRTIRPAGGVHRDCRHEADLRALLALGHRAFASSLIRQADCAHVCAIRDPDALMPATTLKDTTSVDRAVPDSRRDRSPSWG